MDAGMRLRWFEDPEDLDHSWHDLHVFFRTRGVDSHLARVRADPEALLWTPDRQLLAAIADRLSILVWQPTEDGRRGRNQPKPIPRPGVSRESTGDTRVQEKGGKKTAHSAQQIAKLLGW